MILTAFEIYLQDILRNVSSALLVPVMIILAGFCVYALYCLGSIIAEAIMQRSHYKENIPGFISQIESAQPSDVRRVILESGMLEPHKKALLTVANNMHMAPADLFALSTREEELLDEHYGVITARTDQVAKLAPMFGLMGTLIPLGPGIVALGIGDTETLSSSLLIAFDTTVAGLASGAVCSVVGRIRKSWYKKYTDAVHAAMVSILQKAETLRTGTNTQMPGFDAIVQAQEDALKCVEEAERIVEATPLAPQVSDAVPNSEWGHLGAASPMQPTQPWQPVNIKASEKITSGSARRNPEAAVHFAPSAAVEAVVHTTPASAASNTPAEVAEADTSGVDVIVADPEPQPAWRSRLNTRPARARHAARWPEMAKAHSQAEESQEHASMAQDDISISTPNLEEEAKPEGVNSEEATPESVQLSVEPAETAEVTEASNKASDKATAESVTYAVVSLTEDETPEPEQAQEEKEQEDEDILEQAEEIILEAQTHMPEADATSVATPQEDQESRQAQEAQEDQENNELDLIFNLDGGVVLTDGRL